MEGCRSLKLDVNYVVRTARTAPPLLRDDNTVTTCFSSFWTPSGRDSPSGELKVIVTLGSEQGSALLVYDIDHSSRRTGKQRLCVQMKTTPCHFGGVRWWWVCPLSGRRCVKLYLPNGGTLFASRGPGAYALAYESENANAINRSHWRLGRLHRRLGEEYTSLPYAPPPRPKWMRHRTYARIVADWELARERHDEIFVTGSERFLSRFR